MGRRVVFALVAVCAFAGCSRKKVVEAPTPEPVEEVTPTPATPVPKPVVTPTPAPPPARRVPVSTKPPPAELWKEFSGERAFAEVRKQVELGPRPAGSAELEKARGQIIAALEAQAWEVERQDFTATTPHGPVKFANLIARFASDGLRPVPRDTQRVILCSHYDTKKFSTIRFLGANDAGSSTGALLEAARVLALHPALAAKVELVFFDGEEALVQFTDFDSEAPDGLYGSHHYAKTLRDGKRASQFLFGILWDMIGDRDLTITLPPDSPKELAQGILRSAESLALRDRFTFYDRQVYDDHAPLNRVARIPTINLIDFDYLWWHTADDTLERVAPASLQKVGTVTLHYVVSKLH